MTLRSMFRRNHGFGSSQTRALGPGPHLPDRWSLSTFPQAQVLSDKQGVAHGKVSWPVSSLPGEFRSMQESMHLEVGTNKWNVFSLVTL